MRTEVLIGEQLAPHLNALAELRITVFREWPYLYDGERRYEEAYLRKFLACPESIMVLAWDGDRVVGASSGLPLAAEDAALRRPFEDEGWDVAQLFYCGESVLLSEYRGRGLGRVFFDEREAHARRLGYSWICFAGVRRPAEHPRRPAAYVPLDGFWQRRGYEKRPELSTEFSWRDLDEAQESPKPMTFWVRRL
ncbi:GNAT family N-acetyltransferase [Alkalilimnicola sp. S0819]|uniref:GNAT family N-acetyltransferase n=1 Tax=Alkalilimnicola sp. S0819 TaxID=2613922 RepID=UPI001261AA29|nr:GNAT family N-acetyltransferase [Alkalilimnicola sp. S0819]KAB7627816.1 GNAT family N-acetyltransferase [Alkalilimnicola sp. S0819]MPQ15447.1 GNAT family N-acetyltransferase [Alkalilimnicola sp. S0819]